MRINFFMRVILCTQLLNTVQTTSAYENEVRSYEWAIVGAGLAGITALAVLLESGIEPPSVVWIDPEFNVGRVGKYYRNVPGNVQAHRLILYVNSCPYFKEVNPCSFDLLYSCNPEEFQPLYVIVDPLIDFTGYLSQKVTAIKDTIAELNYNDNCWDLQGDNQIIRAKNVILAIGAHPKRLDYDIPEIPLDIALDKEKLAHCISPSDSIAVFGSMHSAILILKYLSEHSLNRIVNFYSNPYFYGVPGLEGDTALWAQNILEHNRPDNLVRVLNTAENRERELSLCTKVIYAIGFKPNPIIVNGSSNLTFDENTGVIDQNLYGIGIAFPPTGIFNGQKIAKNGLHTYLAYAKKLIPQWITQEKSYNQSQNQLIGKEQEELPWI